MEPGLADSTRMRAHRSQEDRSTQAGSQSRNANASFNRLRPEMHPPILVAIIMANLTVWLLAILGMTFLPDLPGSLPGARLWTAFGWIWLVSVFAYRFVI